ncbi:GDSL-type esterase/lipase family protein [Paraglaciecola sp. MB-3u-78]|uniref:GDSL-type esterase/lipase family protein n=1 Tax=Paraglaciecola sp. MB-3u-78 TaxID=2058332 RepID=UPI000C31D123|nr:GDSL-type esterase/lipase family protein [Paraglaciecola sp. MB-3u-78]PKG93378.1 acetylglucosamine-6-sulfatase [Paraglaciecola sp. MB-3u-78]
MKKPLSIISTPRTEDWWLTRHQQKLKELKASDQPIDILFLGDSITHAWEVEGEEYWQQHFVHPKAFNLGFAGDRTEHLLWRIQNGELDSLSPKWVVLLMGTNNAGHRLDAPEDIAAGVQSILDELRHRLPTSKVLLMAIFPRSRNTNKPMRQRVDASNALIKTFTDGKQIHWLDINHQFLTENGVLLESVMPDLLHPNATQYHKWGHAILSYIEHN